MVKIINELMLREGAERERERERERMKVSMKRGTHGRKEGRMGLEDGAKWQDCCQATK